MKAIVKEILRRGTSNTRVILDIGLDTMLSNKEYPSISVGLEIDVPDNIPPERQFSRPLIRPLKK